MRTILDTADARAHDSFVEKKSEFISYFTGGDYNAVTPGVAWNTGK